ncbi:FG-GAP and VCBS repeat-containing protein [Streptomyces sp. NPDC012888]|uniref:FG-GAP and VCBS repeat-containing protein n=1 Tax=Streptomyces sp. NPDC012888 TaxID=3364855 RepID=UPI00367C44E6
MNTTTRRGVVAAAAAAALAGGMPAVPATAAGTGPAPTRHSDDFNGDGYRDLAYSDPEAVVLDAAGVRTTGYVAVAYGSEDGVQRTRTRPLTRLTPGFPGGGGGPTDQYGRILANADFNGDGYADLAVATDRIGENDQQGHVTMLWGSRQGLRGGTNLVDNAPSDQQFGSAMVAGDFDADGKADLVIAHSKRLDLFKGPFSATGEPAAVEQLKIDPGDGGYGLLAGRINRGTTDDLVVSTRRGTDFRSHVLLGGAKGFWKSPQPARGGHAIADFDKDGFGDIATGEVEEVWNSSRTSFLGWKGQVSIRYGSASGIDPARPVQVITRDTPGVAGGRGKWDTFGKYLTAGDITGDGYADLVVGTRDCLPGSGCTGDQGAIHVLKGGKGGVTGTGAGHYPADTPGLPDVAGPVSFPMNDIKTTDLDGDGTAELTFPVHHDTSPQIWSVGTRGGRLANGAPVRVVLPAAGVRSGHGTFAHLTP